MDRREFLARAGLIATWAAIPIALTGCGDDYDNDTTKPPEDGDVAGAVGASSGHSHSVTITEAQLETGEGVTLVLTGSGHTHSVSLTAEEVMSIAGGQRVSKQSTRNSGHEHTVTFN